MVLVGARDHVLRSNGIDRSYASFDVEEVAAPLSRATVEELGMYIH